jgi:hypothetical protein
MEGACLQAGRPRITRQWTWLLFLLACGRLFLESAASAQTQESLTGESAAQSLKEAAQREAQQYNLRYGPVSFRTGASLRVGYTDNVFYSDQNRKDDIVIMPEADLTAFMEVSELNTLKLAVGLGYEYYVKNSELNPSAPLVNPDSELAFNLFVGNVHIRLHEKFSYQETLFINTTAGGQAPLFNFNNVGVFSRWDNLAGLNLDWDLNTVMLSVGYDHENFASTTSGFEYLDRSSELFSASASFPVADQAKVGLESQAGLHNYDTETTLNDHWQARVGPFVDFKLPEKITFRAGGGYDTAQYDVSGNGNNFSTYYAYGRVSQETRLFTHSLGAGHEHLLGQNANNLETTYVRYSISSPVFEHIELGGSASVHFDKEFGGAFLENFTYYLFGLRASYQFHKYWQAELGYEFMLKESDLPLRDFRRNRVSLGVNFTF